MDFVCWTGFLWFMPTAFLGRIWAFYHPWVETQGYMMCHAYGIFGDVLPGLN
jgi:hypothetical protein